MTATNKTQAGGLALLNLSAWIRRQEWLRAIYRNMPATWRVRVSEVLARRAGERLRFKRNSRWARPQGQPQAATDDAAVIPGSFGPAAGVNIFAYARGQFGLAESARLYARALLDAGYPVALYDLVLDLAHSMGDSSLAHHIGTHTPYGINLIFVNPDHLDLAIAKIGPERLAGRYTIGCWFWELDTFPAEWKPAFAHVDEVLVSSGFVRDVVSQVTPKPVLHVPLPVTEPLDSGLGRKDFGLQDETYIFLTSFDFNSYLPRKNPIAAIQAFRKAFPDGAAKVQLLIKSSNGHRHPDRLRELLDAAGDDSRILIRDDIIDRSHVAALQRCADAYVSLHRAEGFGLGMAECMRLGKPVIATGWSGNLEFMTAANSCLVNYTLVEVAPGEYLHHLGQHWADPDIDDAARYMKQLVDDPGHGVRLGHQAAADIRDHLSASTVARALIERLETINNARASGASPASGGVAQQDIIKGAP